MSTITTKVAAVGVSAGLIVTLSAVAAEARSEVWSGTHPSRVGVVHQPSSEVWSGVLPTGESWAARKLVVQPAGESWAGRKLAIRVVTA